MSTCYVVNAIKANTWADEPFSDGTTSRERTARFAGSLSDGPLIELIPPGGRGALKGATPMECGDTVEELVTRLEEAFSLAERIVYVWADTPFLDPELTRDLLAHHHLYMSQYTFSDGWPIGLAPEILENRIMEKLSLLARGDRSPLKRDSLFTLIQKDINAFDLETIISPKDFRLLRLTLAGDSKRNHLLLNRFIEAGLTTGKALAEGLDQSQNLLRTLPAFYQLQITNRRLQKPSYLPVPPFTDGDGEMGQEDFSLLLNKISRLSRDGVISLSLWGEPSLHSRIYEMMAEVLTHDFRLLVETSGRGWEREKLLPLLEREGSRIDWIVELDALDPALYRALRGEGQEEALDFIAFLGENCGENLYVQTTRMGENEDHLESLYQTWKGKPGKLIIKKYDHFCGRLPSRKVTELAPLDRNPCWHIKRDMAVLLDGTVLFCQEALDGEKSPGNLIKEEPETIWSRGEALYLDHLDGKILSPCSECDEYYTYNF